MINRKIILVTGSNKGIGLEIVRQLAAQGHEVILTTRSEGKGKEAVRQLSAENLSVHFILLDITNEKSIEHAEATLREQFGKLDVLINNAAILLKEDVSLLSNSWSTIQATIESNSFAQLRVTRAFQQLFVKGSRVIMTSSGGGSMTDPVGGWSPAYCISKSFLNAITRHLAHEWSSQQISVNAFCPGWVKTDMGGKSAPRSVEQGAETAVWLATVEKIASGKFFRDRREILW